MTAGSGEFTGNSDLETLSDRELIHVIAETIGTKIGEHLADLRKQLDHIDGNCHDIQRQLAGVERQVGEMHAELEAARPLLEKWQRSKIVKLASGGLPWGPSAGERHVTPYEGNSGHA